MNSPFDCVRREPAHLGECPRWDARAQRLLWIDIQAPALHCYDPANGTDTTVAMDEHIGCIAQHESGHLVAGMRTGLWLLDATGRKLVQLATNPEDHAASRFNDGRADPAGRFWTGTIDEPRAGGQAHLYRYDTRGLHDMGGGLLTSNGLAFSPDGRWLYHSDTPRFVVYRYPFDTASGTLGAREVFLAMDRVLYGSGRPDGAAVDVDGCYWSALYEGGCVIRVAPDGRILARYELPVRCPTMCAFGDADLRTLYVTSASAGRDAEELESHPLSGGLFAMRVPVAGLPEPRCTFPLPPNF